MTESIPAATLPRPIERAAELEALVAELSTVPRVALDAEGDGFYRYRARTCTLQLASGARVAVIDTLAIQDLSPLAALLGPRGPMKVVHDAAFDARMLAKRGCVLGNVFDTAVAARFLGESATGLSSLLSRHLGVELAKEQQQADWGRRPLEAEQMAYLVADVEHLLPLAALLEARLREEDLVEEAEEESRYVLARALDPEPERAPWTRIKGARELGEASLALLAALADVREGVAEQRDVPPFRVAPNGALFEAARRGPELSRLRSVRGLRGLDDAKLREAIERARRGPPSEPVVEAPPSEERSRRRGREKALTEWRRAEAQARGVDAQVVLPGHCLRDLAAAGARSREDLARIEGLGEKRIARYGDALIALLG